MLKLTIKERVHFRKLEMLRKLGYRYRSRSIDMRYDRGNEKKAVRYDRLADFFAKAWDHEFNKGRA